MSADFAYKSSYHSTSMTRIPSLSRFKTLHKTATTTIHPIPKHIDTFQDYEHNTVKNNNNFSFSVEKKPLKGSYECSRNLYYDSKNALLDEPLSEVSDGSPFLSGLSAKSSSLTAQTTTGGVETTISSTIQSLGDLSDFASEATMLPTNRLNQCHHQQNLIHSLPSTNKTTSSILLKHQEEELPHASLVVENFGEKDDRRVHNNENYRAFDNTLSFPYQQRLNQYNANPNILLCNSYKNHHFEMSENTNNNNITDTITSQKLRHQKSLNIESNQKFSNDVITSTSYNNNNISSAPLSYISQNDIVSNSLKQNAILLNEIETSIDGIESQQYDITHDVSEMILPPKPSRFNISSPNENNLFLLPKKHYDYLIPPSSKLLFTHQNINYEQKENVAAIQYQNNNNNNNLHPDSIRTEIEQKKLRHNNIPRGLTRGRIPIITSLPHEKYCPLDSGVFLVAPTTTTNVAHSRLLSSSFYERMEEDKARRQARMAALMSQRQHQYSCSPSRGRSISTRPKPIDHLQHHYPRRDISLQKMLQDQSRKLDKIKQNRTLADLIADSERKALYIRKMREQEKNNKIALSSSPLRSFNLQKIQLDDVKRSNEKRSMMSGIKNTEACFASQSSVVKKEKSEIKAQRKPPLFSPTKSNVTVVSPPISGPPNNNNINDCSPPLSGATSSPIGKSRLRWSTDGVDRFMEHVLSIKRTQQCIAT